MSISNHSIPVFLTRSALIGATAVTLSGCEIGEPGVVGWGLVTFRPHVDDVPIAVMPPPHDEFGILQSHDSGDWYIRDTVSGQVFGCVSNSTAGCVQTADRITSPGLNHGPTVNLPEGGGGGGGGGGD